MVSFAVLTSSDMGSSGKRADTSGDIAVEMMMAAGHQLVDRAITPDERPRIIEYLKRWSFSGEMDVILTTGGTGLGPRDVTPEATMDVLEYQVPGMAEAMRAESLKVTPMAMISPGRRRGAREDADHQPAGESGWSDGQPRRGSTGAYPRSRDTA